MFGIQLQKTTNPTVEISDKDSSFSSVRLPKALGLARKTLESSSIGRYNNATSGQYTTTVSRQNGKYGHESGGGWTSTAKQQQILKSMQSNSSQQSNQFKHVPLNSNAHTNNTPTSSSVVNDRHKKQRPSSQHTIEKLRQRIQLHQQDKIQNYLNQHLDSDIQFSMRKYRQQQGISQDLQKHQITNLRPKSTVLPGVAHSVTMTGSIVEDDLTLLDGLSVHHNNTFYEMESQSVGADFSVTEMKKPRRLIDMKYFSGNQSVPRPNFKLIKDNEPLVGNQSPQQRRIPVQKRKNRNKSIDVSSSDESTQKKRFTTPYLQQQRTFKKVRDQKQVTVSQKQLAASPKNQPQVSMDKQTIIDQISKMQFTQNDVRALREALTSKFFFGNLRYIQLMKEGSKPAEIQFFLSNFREIFHSVMDTIDLKLSECYWTGMAELIEETSSFPRFLTQLDIWDVLVKHFEMFLPSQSFQKAILYVVLECGFKFTKANKLSQQLSERLIQVVMDVFQRCSNDDQECLSFCLWSMYLYVSKNAQHDSPNKLISLIMENQPVVSKKLVNLLANDRSFGAILTPLKNLFVQLTYSLQRKDVLYNQILINNGIYVRINEMIKGATKSNKLAAACQMMQVMINKQCKLEVMRNQVIFLNLSEKAKRDVRSVKDVELNIEYFKIYKNLLEMGISQDLVCALEIVQILMLKLDQVLRLKAQHNLINLLLDVLEILIQDYDSDLINSYVLEYRHRDLIFTRLQELDSHKIYKRAYWLLVDNFNDEQEDVFCIDNVNNCDFMLS
ncbi:UNKNOWN [Stylonychia lemnae]|uniref:Uncharacterized protein n=1 Tax=Stylonychia lemnae TaxID=5949 RepID=A0A077ZN67_STYLE|nr:UNKNOWN [Stylonychia lemnae]|eukprot:CDW71363.1 UNKNOWN [Stylonychia lemnae]